jgi:uracil-DNA glycosylase family 4
MLKNKDRKPNENAAVAYLRRETTTGEHGQGHGSRETYRRKDNCATCPFHSRTCGPRGPLSARIAIVGESPGTQEIRHGEPFIGPSGELLSTLLREVGIPEDEVYITNALACLPPRSKDKDGNSIKDGKINEAARACRHRMFEELVQLPNLELVISMGSVALRSLSEAWGASILKKRGQVIAAEDCLVPATEWLGEDGLPKANHWLPRRGYPICDLGVLPTLHPAYILRNQAALPQLRSDLAKAKRLLDGEGYPKPTIEYRILETPGAIEHVIRLHTQVPKGGLKAPLRVVADIETTGLDRYGDSFICIGFQFEHKISEGRNIVYVVTGKGRGTLVRHLFKRMPLSVEWVWHNGKFDTGFLRAKGIPRDQCRTDQDTLLLSYTLDETGQRHSLEQCIIDHLGLPAYKDMLQDYVGSGKKKKAYADVPRPLLYEYMAKDVIFTGLLFKKLHPQVMNPNKPHLTKAYLDLLIPASNALTTVELNGMPIDQEVLEAAIEELEGKIAPLLIQMAEVAGDDDFNPNSHIQVLRILKSRGMKITTTNKDTLKKFKDDPLVKLLLEYAKYRKLLSTYLVAFRKYGRRVHTSYLIHGTVTGRLSSSSPNMQNIPKEEIVRRHFRAPNGRVFVSFDYSQAELRSLAVLSGDKNLIDIFASGKDMHSAVAAKVYGEEFTREAEFILNPKTSKVDLENPIFNKLRRNAKTVNFGIVYGATEYTLMERLGITWDEAHELIVGWFAMFPDARKFMNECRRAPREGRPLITVFGRQRRFYVVTAQNRNGQENEAGNFPHQSMCSDFTLDAAIQIDRLAAKGPLPGNACQINIIHDDNLFECDDNDAEVVKLVKLVRPIMEGTPVRHGITALPFKSDAKKGYVWSSMQKIAGV